MLQGHPGGGGGDLVGVWGGGGGAGVGLAGQSSAIGWEGAAHSPTVDFLVGVLGNDGGKKSHHPESWEWLS